MLFETEIGRTQVRRVAAFPYQNREKRPLINFGVAIYSFDPLLFLMDNAAEFGGREGTSEDFLEAAQLFHRRTPRGKRSAQWARYASLRVYDVADEHRALLTVGDDWHLRVARCSLHSAARSAVGLRTIFYSLIPIQPVIETQREIARGGNAIVISRTCGANRLEKQVVPCTLRERTCRDRNGSRVYHVREYVGRDGRILLSETKGWGDKQHWQREQAEQLGRVVPEKRLERLYRDLPLLQAAA